MPMNPELKKKWVDALRSGEYKQGKGILNGERGFCCLGVLCEVMELPKEKDGDRFIYRFGPNYANSLFIPDVFLSTIGLTYLAANQLAGYNDAGKSFAFIAKNIEKRKTL